MSDLITWLLALMGWGPPKERQRKPWTVDRDGRVRTDARPVVLSARRENEAAKKRGKG